MSQRDAFDRVLASLYEAMLDDTHWPATAGLFDEACRISGNALVVGSGHPQDGGGNFFASFSYHGQRDHERPAPYFDLYYPQDERPPRVRHLPDSQLVRMADLYSKQERKTSPTYNEWLPRDGYQNGLNVRLDGPHGAHIVWNIADSTERGGWGTAQTEMIERLLPHVRQYVRVRQALVDAEARGASLSGLLDNTRVGVIHLDRQGRIIEANDRAHDMLRRGDGLLDRGGFLRAWLPTDNANLEALLARALLASGAEAVSGSMTVRRSPGLPRFTLHVNPVSTRQMEFRAWRIAAFVLVVEPAIQARIDLGGPTRVDPDLVAITLGADGGGESDSGVVVGRHNSA